jgi:hypothetical protein
MKACGSGCIDPHFLDLGTSWRWVVNFTTWPIYPRGRSPQYPLDRRFGGRQSRSGRFEEENILDRTGTRTCFWWLGSWTGDSPVHTSISLIWSQIFRYLLSRIWDHGYVMELQVHDYDLHITAIGGTGLSIKQ